MVKRAGALASMSLLMALTALPLMAGAVSAKPWNTVTIQETSACHFSVWYAWTGMGHGNDLTATVSISGWENGNSSGLGSFQSTNRSGRDGVLNHDFVVTGQSIAYQFKATGYLSIPSKSQVIAKSVAMSLNLVPASPELCS